MMLSPLQMSSAIPGILWPPAPHPMGAQLYYQLNYFNCSEKFPIAEILKNQFSQLLILLNYSRQTVPYYQDKLKHLPTFKNWEALQQAWKEIPLLTREDLQQARESIFAMQVPSGHEPSELLSTSGSTGRPVTVKGNIATQFYWNAFSLRNHLWHGDEFDKSFASIRYTENKDALPPLGTKFLSWSPATYPIVKTGPCYHLTLCTPEEEAIWLQRVNPDYLNCNPSTLREITLYLAKHGKKLGNLKKIHTHSEIVEPALRDLVKEVFDVPLVDNYSSKECGYIALECPVSGYYHVQSENVLVEILDENNKPCAVNQPGRVVVTVLHNFSSPLIRYDIGDYAIPGDICSCGRNLPVLKQILGRKRNMLQMPGGQRFWPAFASQGIRMMDLFSCSQFQVVQTSLTELQINLVRATSFTAQEEQVIRDKLKIIFNYPFNFYFNFVDSIPRSAGGKFEDFISLIE
ncbi:phenylacetate--CoA ligase family protein [Legionella sp. CNM-1927-20]|uniref:phenylacetate--CoA ligase family protein n=1 Tax=Legionella sp. CNM-1927-20 TaxID=3422221 RepID=UPI00403AE776